MVHVAFGPPRDRGRARADAARATSSPTASPASSMKIVDDDGRLLDVRASSAWDSGVVMDIGHGTGSFSYETAEALMAAGRAARRDLDRPPPAEHQRPRVRPADLPEQVPAPRACRCRDVIRAATTRAGRDPRAGPRGRHAAAGLARRRRALPPARAARFPLYDIWGEMREASALLVNTLTIVGGRPLRAAAAAGRPRRGPTHPIWPAAQIPFTERQQAFRDRGHTPGRRCAAPIRAELTTARCRARRPASGRRTAPPSTTVSARSRG